MSSFVNKVKENQRTKTWDYKGKLGTTYVHDTHQAVNTDSLDIRPVGPLQA